MKYTNILYGGLLVLISSFAYSITAEPLWVGTGHPYATITDAFEEAHAGDTIYIETALYLNDTIAWWQDDLVIEGIPNTDGTLPRIQTTGVTTDDAGIWIFYGDNIVVRNLQFSNAISQEYHDGAGIVFGGQDIQIDSCVFLNNQRGVVVYDNIDSDVRIAHCEFGYNQSTEQLRNHHILVGKVRSFTLSFSYLHHVDSGHHVFSNAAKTQIFYNRIMDENEGSSAFLINVDKGGETYIVGNVLMSGPQTMYGELIAYGHGGLDYQKNIFSCYNNTLVQSTSKGPFIWIAQPVSLAKIFNNLFIGDAPIAVGAKAMITNNRQSNISQAQLANITQFDYHLTAASPGIDKAIDPVELEVEVLPTLEYVHPRKAKMRLIANTLDVGAFELE